MTQRFEGKNLEEALDQASAALGVERYQIKYGVLVEKRGFLGGVKRVVIEAGVNPDATAPVVAAAPEPLPPLPREERAPRSGGRGESRGGGRGGDRGRRGGRGDRGDLRGRGGDDRWESRRSRPRDTREAIPDQENQSEAATKARDWCETVIDLTDLDVVIRTIETEQAVTVRFYGPDTRLLVDHNGELLDAMQVLANKALVGRSVEKPLEFDAGEFKEQREEELTDRARALADRVRNGGGEQLLPAMSPIERRIVHIALREDADVTTESRGEGFYKRVAIIRRSDAAPGEPAAAPEQ